MARPSGEGSMNYTAVLWVNGVRQTMAETTYRDRDDALRRCFIWRCADEEARFGPVQVANETSNAWVSTPPDGSFRPPGTPGLPRIAAVRMPVG
jgi:hypothetical protein